MVRSMVAKGKNIEEAIDSALHIMDTDREEVNIEVIDSGKQRLLWAKPAIVKVTLFEEVNKVDTLQQTEKDLLDNIEETSSDTKVFPDKYVPVFTKARDSKIGIENGEIYYQQGENAGYPTIVPTKDITLLKNGEEVSGTTIVEPGDVFQVCTEEKKEVTSWKTSIDEKKMRATLHLHVGKIIKTEVVKQRPVRHLEIRTREVERVENSLTEEEVYQWLEKEGITEGIDSSRISEAVHSEISGPFVVAEGIQPQPGTNGDIEFFIDTTVEKVEYKEKADGTMDFKNARKFPNVSRGQVIGQIIDPVPGTQGLNIYGATIPAPLVHELKLRNDSSVQVLETNQLVSLAEGRLDVEQVGILCKVRVVPKLFVNRDVDIKYGNVDYYGDVEIMGSILEYMKVKARGEVRVHGAIHFSKVETSRSIFSNKSVIQSNLSAGDRTYLIQELIDEMKKISLGIEKCVVAANQLMGVSAFSKKDISRKGLSSLLRLLMEKKLAWVRKAMQKYVGRVNKHEDSLEEEWLLIRDTIEKGFLLYHPESFQTLAAVKEFEEYIARWLEAVDGDVAKQTEEVVIPYALESQIYSSGHIRITGTGCYNSKLHAGDAIDIEGVVRGGYLFGEKKVNVKETGVEGGGVHTIIGTSTEGVINIDTVYEDTILLVGNQRHLFLEAMHDVRARLDEDGKIALV